jgi:hypothetical protein
MIDESSAASRTKLSLYTASPAGPPSVRRGREQANWGQSLAFRVGDVINPQDTTWNFGFANLEQSRTPQWMVHPIFNLPDLGPFNSNFLEGVLIPGVQPVWSARAARSSGGGAWTDSICRARGRIDEIEAEDNAIPSLSTSGTARLGPHEFVMCAALHQLHHCVAPPPLDNQANLVDLTLLARIPARMRL